MIVLCLYVCIAASRTDNTPNRGSVATGLTVPDPAANGEEANVKQLSAIVYQAQSGSRQSTHMAVALSF